MNQEKFELLAVLLRSREPVKTAARLVLLDGMPNLGAATLAGVFPQSSSRAVKSFRDLDKRIATIYGAGPQ